MFTLETAKSKFFRVREGVSAGQIESALSVPVCGELYAGRLLFTGARYRLYRARAGDTYASVARAAGVEEERLRAVNGSRAIYPTRRIFIPEA